MNEAVAPLRSFLCPLPPSVNAAYRNTRRGRARTAEYRRWADSALIFLKQQKIEPVQGVCVILYGFERRSGLGDVSNRPKLAEDILVRAGIIEDDRFVTATAISWLPYADGMTHISIYPVAPIDLTLHPSGDGTTAAWISHHQHKEGNNHGPVAC